MQTYRLIFYNVDDYPAASLQLLAETDNQAIAVARSHYHRLDRIARAKRGELQKNLSVLMNYNSIAK